MLDLLMPKLGLTMQEGLLSEWLVSVGDHVSAGNLLFIVETEKVANEVEAETDGVIGEILVTAGETVPVGTIVAKLTDGIEMVTSVVPAAPVTPKTPPPPAEQIIIPSPNKISNAERILSTPLARRVAKQTGVDITLCNGSGPRGRIKVADVHEIAGNITTRNTDARMQQTPIEIEPDLSEPSSARLETARRVGAAKRDIPHFYVSHEVEVSELNTLRDSLNSDDIRARISVTHMLIKALGLALHQMPEMNRIWLDEKIVSFNSADIGVVIETDIGLRIPVVRDAGMASLDDLSANATAAFDRAQNGSMMASDIGNCAISISNVGMFGVTSMTPIINPTNAMILGVGGRRSVFRPDSDGSPKACQEISLTLASDHRIIDGADAARFLSLVVSICENPISLLRYTKP